MQYEYMNSGVEWIGEIPRHWKIKKLKRVLSEKLKYGATESGEFDNPDDPRFIRITDFNDDGTFKNDTFKSLPFEIATNYLLREGDVLFARSGATVGKTFIFNNYNGIACFAGYLIRASTLRYKLLPEFLFYYTKSKAYNEWKNLIFTQATIQNIGADKYQYLDVPVSQLREQIAIVAFLDKACANIDRVVEIKQKQIENLQQQLKSIIHQTITKGLNPEVELKDSGIEWIGKMPKHWKIDRLKDLVKLRRKKTSKKSENEDYLELEDLEKETGKIFGFRNTIEVSGKVTIFKKGDVLFGKLRPYLNKHYLAEKDGKCTGEILAFQCKRILNRYFEYCISSHGFIEKCTVFSYGAKMPRVDYNTQLATFYLPIPPQKEQEEISTLISKKKERVLVVQSKIEKQIETLLAYKKSLIHEVVTGKKQVYFSKQPEETVEST